MKKALFFAICVLFIAAGAAQADYLGTLVLQNIDNSNAITLDLHGDPTGQAGTETVHGGSLAGSTLNGAPLPYVYCVGLTTDVGVPYNGQAYVNSTLGNLPVATPVGQVFDNFDLASTSLGPVPDAGQVAWLLATYGASATTTDLQVALQAAIWHVISANGGYPTLGVVSLDQMSDSAAYPIYLSDLANLGSKTASTSTFLWMTPGIFTVQGPTVTATAAYQGLVAPVPIPGALALLCPGLAALVGLRKRFKM